MATIVGLLFIFFGNVLMDVFKFSATAMSLAGGLILLIYAIKSILKEPKPGAKKGYATDREAEQMAIYPLAVPLMASPMGLVTLTVISANIKVTLEGLAGLTVMLLVVMAINLALCLRWMAFQNTSESRPWRWPTASWACRWPRWPWRQSSTGPRSSSRMTCAGYRKWA